MPRSPGKPYLIAYMPVLHRGYLQMFEAYPQAETIYLIDRSDLPEETISYLRKDLRQLTPQQAARALSGLERFKSIGVLNASDIKDLDKAGNEMILPDEDISRIVAERFKTAKITYHPVFLRWDRRSIEGINIPAAKTDAKTNKEDAEFMNQAFMAVKNSSDIWRRVGATLISKDRKIIGSAANKGEPTAYSPLIEGDPRNIFNRGVGVEMSVFTHAEAVLIAQAAKEGVSLKGARIYATDFPCPACAKLIAHSGISHLYYAEGYAVLDGERILNDHDVKIHRVKIAQDNGDSPVWVPYDKS